MRFFHYILAVSYVLVGSATASPLSFDNADRAAVDALRARGFAEVRFSDFFPCIAAFCCSLEDWRVVSEAPVVSRSCLTQ